MDFDKLLVSTKFSPPHIGSRFIARKQLLEQLSEGRRCNFVLVTGGAGFGKTVLLAQWRRELLKAGDEVSWLSLSHDDRQITSFTTYLIAALGRLGIEFQEEMRADGIDGDIGNSLDAVVAATLNAAAAIPKDLYLIIDDYHHVDDPRAHRMVQKLIDHCPANFHLAIASRSAPPVAIGRLRVRGRVTEIGFGELPFELDETRSFLAQNLGKVRLQEEEVRLIHDKTGGWPASLELMSIMLRARPDTRARLRDLVWNSADLQAYLTEEVVAHLPAHMIDFMEGVSICRRFNVDLAAAVTGHPDAASLIQRAEEENLLMYRVESDDRLPWYRFHPLFGEFLGARLAQRAPEDINELHKRASRWFSEHGLLMEAVRHAIHGGELTFAAEAIDRAERDGWSLSYISLMLNLLDRLPQSTLFAHPRLFFLSCLILAITARHAKAQRWLDQIRQSDAARNPAVSSKLPLVDAALAVQRDDAQRCIQLLEPMRRVAAESPYLHYFYLSLLSSSLAAVGRYADARQLLDENPIDPSERTNDVALVAEGARALVLLTEGDVRSAVSIGSELLPIMESLHGRHSVGARVSAATLCDVYYELDRTQEARAMLANRSGVVMRASLPPLMLCVALVAAKLESLDGSADTAVAFLEAQAAHQQGLGLPRLQAWMLGEAVRVLLAANRRAEAAEVLARLADLDRAGGAPELAREEIAAVVAMARARVALASHDPRSALEALVLARDFARQRGRARIQVQEGLLAAQALYDLKRLDEMGVRLIEVVQFASQHGLIRTVVDEGAAVAALIAQIKDDPRLDVLGAEHARKLLDHLGKGGAPGPASPSRGEAAQGPRATLTPREVEILALVAQAMSNKRIALTLNISADTVKWNVRNILTKLDLSSRYDAMTWARKQGLIE